MITNLTDSLYKNYGNGQTKPHCIHNIPCGGKIVSHVAFERYDVELGVSCEIVVHWTRVFDVLHANGAMRVSKVYWADEIGGAVDLQKFGYNGWSFAKWFQDRRTGEYRIGAGTYGDSMVLQELPLVKSTAEVS